jgi:hypothetical protein
MARPPAQALTKFQYPQVSQRMRSGSESPTGQKSDLANCERRHAIASACQMALQQDGNALVGIELEKPILLTRRAGRLLLLSNIAGSSAGPARIPNFAATFCRIRNVAETIIYGKASGLWVKGCSL